MNQFEIRMVSILQELKEAHGAISVRAEFESEGSRIEELLRLKEISCRAGLGLTLIIGGCESLRDLIESRAVGVNTIAAPMIESGYALQKYLQAVVKVFPQEELEHIEVYANVESAMGMRNLDKILASVTPVPPCLRGIVIERVDLCHSLGLDSDSINCPEINEKVASAAGRIAAQGLRVTIGGGVSADSLPFFRELDSGHIDRFETRKVVFNAQKALSNRAERGIMAALAFELFYLKNKLTYPKNIKIADLNRLNLLEQLYWNAISMSFPAGGNQ